MNHDFHSKEYVRSYVDSINQRRPERKQMFEHIAEHLSTLPFQNPHIVELGAGAGMVAEVILSRLPEITYESFDFSKPMIDLAQIRLAPYKNRVALHRANLKHNDWISLLTKQPHAFISNMALHDLGSEARVHNVYSIAQKHLASGGLLINAELVLSVDKEESVRNGWVKVSKHIDILQSLGFVNVHCSLDFGNYACIVAAAP